MKMTYGELKRLLRERAAKQFKDEGKFEFLNEAGEDDLSTEPEVGADDSEEGEVMPTQEEADADRGDSVDAQIDRYLTDYENEAKNAVQSEGVSFRTMFQQFLNEAGEETQDTGETGGEDIGTAIEQPEINIESFTDSVVRLIDNYDSLLEVRDTIAKRAMKFLEKAYSEDVVNSFKDQLREQYDIELDKSEDEVDREKNPPPPADRAGEGFGSGAAGGPGGGV